ncbi:hypothetical protein [Ascidiimonas sp. W6]|uniref:hypothetical protein n=1 Tax=Ascidiimonas meishanensis TaxID=3128903 RepID=UPI0030ED7F46
MSNNPQDEKFKKWLDILQQESWQLELIISGFAIFGLFAIKEPIHINVLEAEMQRNVYASFLWQGLMISWVIITFNLIIHVVLRGLWIGAIGLRYVSDDIDYDKLSYSKKFTNHLQKRIGSFDNYVATLEKYCSIIFAVTFLLVFYLIGLLLITFLLTLIGLWIDKEETSRFYRFGIGIPLIIFISIGSVFTFFDFITQGWLKKKKWTTFLYYPFYWVFKYLTLSFLYRPMVYNFLDTKFGKRLSLILVPLYMGIIILAGTGFSTSNYINKNLKANKVVADQENYYDEITKATQFVHLAAIPSKVITNPFLNVFIAYGKSIEDDVFYFEKSLEPEEDKRGIFSIFSSGVVKEAENKLPLYLQTVEEMYTFKIDSLELKGAFIVSRNQRKQIGFETFLDIGNVNKGKHALEIWRKDYRKDSIIQRKIITIPFWYYPE